MLAASTADMANAFIPGANTAKVKDTIIANDEMRLLNESRTNAHEWQNILSQYLPKNRIKNGSKIRFWVYAIAATMMTGVLGAFLLYLFT